MLDVTEPALRRQGPALDPDRPAVSSSSDAKTQGSPSTIWWRAPVVPR
jgi:hypothetical protein